MSALLDRLRGLSFFRQLDLAAAETLAADGDWYSLPGGRQLFLEGERSEAFYLVISGRLIVVRRRGDEEAVLGYIRAGEPVGEMSLLSDTPHSASVFALRDTEVLALPRPAFERLLHESGDFASALARAVLARSREAQSGFRRASPRVFALIASSPSIDIERRARALAEAIGRLGPRVRLLGEDDADHAFLSFEAQENACDFVLLTARMGDTGWFRFVLRHADRFFVFARRDARAHDKIPLSPSDESPARRFRLVDLVMAHEGAPAGGVREWAEAVEADRVFHWTDDRSVDRLARVIAGRSVGLVLSGGGARAYAHIGAVRALRERGVPIDFLAGASMGAIVAACVAMNWGDGEIERRIRDAFVSSNPLGDHVLPVVALTRGALVEERLARHFGDALIEDLKTPFFCVSSELTRGNLRIHQAGSVRRALRASISLPGILPPVVDDDALLVDGAVMNNFPADLMSTRHRGLTIGVDVAEEGTIRAADFDNPPGFFRWVRRNGFRSAPPIISLLMRAATAREGGKGGANPADIMVTPKVAGVELRDWKKFETAVADGYRSMNDALDARWDDLAPIVEKRG